MLPSDKTDHLFVYGTLRSDQNKAMGFLDRDSTFICNGYTADDFVMMRTNSFPVLFNVWDQLPVLPVYGELWEIPSTLLAQTDRIEAQGYMYKRERRKIISVDETESFEAWVYVGIPKTWYNSPLHTMKATSDQYYDWGSLSFKKVG